MPFETKDFRGIEKKSENTGRLQLPIFFILIVIIVRSSV